MSSSLIPIPIDLKALSEPATKFIDVISKGIGKLYEPKHVVRMAKAASKAALIEFEGKEDIAQRAAIRVNNIEIKRQENIDEIITCAYELLPEQVSSEKVDDDWITQFFNIAQDISNEKMQLIWSKILANETAQPGSFSLRSMYELRLFSAGEANLITQLSNYCWKLEGDNFPAIIYLTSLASPTYQELPLNLLHLKRLEAMGLLNLGTHFEYKEPKNFTVSYFDKTYRFNIKPITHLGAIILTPTGIEIASIPDSAPDSEYRDKILNSFASRGIEITEVK